MFGINWADANSFWLNVTNVGLGIAALILCLAVAHALFKDVISRDDEDDR